MTNWDRSSVRISSDSVGRCEINMVFLLLLLGTRYLMPLRCLPGRVAVAEDCSFLLRVVLDDQLLSERHLDLRTLRQLVDQDALALPHDLQPARDRALTRGLPRDLERHRVHRLVPHVDDVVLRYPVAGDVDAHAVDREVAVRDELTGHPAGTGQPGSVDQVAPPARQVLQQLVTGLPGTAGRL